MKKFLCYLLIFSIIFVGSATIANAESINHSETIEYLEDGSYFVTTIDTVSENPFISILSSTSTCSGKKR